MRKQLLYQELSYWLRRLPDTSRICANNRRICYHYTIRYKLGKRFGNPQYFKMKYGQGNTATVTLTKWGTVIILILIVIMK